MSKGRDYFYHVERARAEMDCAYRAADGAAATAHMKLSALHMDRARVSKGLGESGAADQESEPPVAARIEADSTAIPDPGLADFRSPSSGSSVPTGLHTSFCGART